MTLSQKQSYSRISKNRKNSRSRKRDENVSKSGLEKDFGTISNNDLKSSQSKIMKKIKKSQKKSK